MKNGKGVIVNMASEAGLKVLKRQVPMLPQKQQSIVTLVHGQKSWVGMVSCGWNCSRNYGSYRDFELFLMRKLAYTRGKTVEDIRAGYASTSTTPLGRSGKLREVADLVAFYISDRSSYITGVTTNIAGGKTRG